MNEEKLQKTFSQAFGIDPSEVHDGLAYTSIPEWDSAGHMALIAEMEDTFGVMFDTDDIIALSSVARAREILGKYGVVFGEHRKSA